MSVRMVENGISGQSYSFSAFNLAGEVWNDSAFEAWNDANYLTQYKLTATEEGASGRFVGTAPDGTVRWELRTLGVSLATSLVWGVTEDASLSVIERYKADADLGTGAGGMVANAATAATQATAAALDASKIPRLTDAIAAGAAVRRNKVAATSATLDETLEATP